MKLFFMSSMLLRELTALSLELNFGIQKVIISKNKLKVMYFHTKRLALKKRLIVIGHQRSLFDYLLHVCR